MKYANETHKRVLRAIHDLEITHLREHHSHEYEKGWDDAMASAEGLVNNSFTAPHGQSPLEHRLDNVLAQNEGAQITANDPVNHPSHYTTGKIEVIDFLEDQGFPYHLGNAVKYICRAGKKDPKKTVEDLQKAVWYLNRYIGLLKKEGGTV